MQIKDTCSLLPYTMWEMQNSRPAGRIRPPNVLYPALRAGYKIQEIFMSDEDFMSEFKLDGTINNFATY